MFIMWAMLFELESLINSSCCSRSVLEGSSTDFVLLCFIDFFCALFGDGRLFLLEGYLPILLLSSSSSAISLRLKFSWTNCYRRSLSSNEASSYSRWSCWVRSIISNLAYYLSSCFRSSSSFSILLWISSSSFFSSTSSSFLFSLSSWVQW